MNDLRRIDLAILGAVEREVESLYEILHEPRSFSFCGKRFFVGGFLHKILLIGATGIGKVNAAITVAGLLGSFSISQVWNIGCAGFYAGSPLEIGDVMVTKEFICGDEGVLTKAGTLPAEHIGIPLLVHDGNDFYDRIPVDSVFEDVRKCTPEGRYCLRKNRIVPEAIECNGSSRAQPAEGTFQLYFGPSLTVGMVSGDEEIAAQRYARYGAFAENMEGSALAQTCCRFEKTFIECRGISNQAGIRDKKKWEFEKAIAHCHGVIMNWLTTETFWFF